MSLFPPPQIPHPADEDQQRLKRLDALVDASHRRWLLVFLGGWLVLAAWLPLAVAGWPGAGVVFVPIGLGMVIGAGVQLLVDRLAG
jgi:hypothetical protein